MLTRCVRIILLAICCSGLSAFSQVATGEWKPGKSPNHRGGGKDANGQARIELNHKMKTAHQIGSI